MSDELNRETLVALSVALGNMRAEYDDRLRSLENEIATLKQLVQRQNQVLGEAFQRMMGRGSTVAEE